MKQHLIITGCGRGGTSITGQVFGRHPRSALHHEKAGFWIQKNLHVPLMGPLSAEDATPERRQKAAAWANTEPRYLLVDKDPRHVLRMPFIRALWPDAKLVYIVRDGRDIACSVMKAWNRKGINPTAWIAKRRMPPHLEKQVRDEAGRRSFHTSILVWWAYCVEADMAALADDPGVEFLFYEKMLADPVGTFGRLFDFVGLDSEPCMKLISKVSDDPSVHVSPLSAGNFVGGHPRRVGRWRHEWTEEAKAHGWEVAGETLASLGYERD